MRQQEDFLFPEGIDLGGPVATGTSATEAALVHGHSRKLAHEVAKGTLAPFERSPVIRVITLEGGFVPLVHVLGQGHLAIAGDELVEGYLLGRNGIETMVRPIGIAQVKKHVPTIPLYAGGRRGRPARRRSPAIRLGSPTEFLQWPIA